MSFNQNTQAEGKCNVDKASSWWKTIKWHPMVTISIIVACTLGIVIFIVLAYWFNWEWTGFGPYNSATNHQREKTLWDWLQLLLIPLLIAGGGWWFNRQQQTRNQQAIEKQHETDSHNANDQQEEAALQSYLDHMSDLLLGNNTGKDSPSSLGSAKPNDEISQVARTRTLTLLRSVDGKRKRIILQFLYDSHLISSTMVVDLRGADLSGANLSGANLSDANLQGTNLSNADLDGAQFTSANLRNANLNGATLKSATLNRKANLAGANLSNADLSSVDFNGEANLSNANLSGANLSNSILMGAVLQGANLSGADLREARLLLPDTYLVGAISNRMTQWPAQFNPEKAQVIKKDIRILPAFVDFTVFPAHQANMTLDDSKKYESWFDTDHIKVRNAQQVVVKFDLQQDDLAKTIVTVNGLISQYGPNNAGSSPISLQLNGQAFQSNYSMPGGGFLPVSQSFSAPQEQLISGPNELTLTVAPDAITYFWLYRLEVGLKSP